MKQEPNDKLFRFINGDEATFTAIFTLLYNSIINSAISLLKNIDEAEDVTSDSFLKLLRSEKKFESIEKIRMYLYTTARNACLDVLKHKKIITENEPEVLNQFLLEHETPTDNEVIKTELIQRLHVQIENLPNKNRAIFKMNYFEGLNREEIASQMHISKKTVRNHINRALKGIRDLLLP